MKAASEVSFVPAFYRKFRNREWETDDESPQGD
jgi:hypothetical protein